MPRSRHNLEGVNECPQCHALRTSDPCLNCRKNNYFSKTGRLVDECLRCHIVKRLYANAQCDECLDEQGLKECSSCHEIKLAHLEFSEKQGRCKACRGPSGLTKRERATNARLRRDYGISLADYEAMLVAQDDRCAICGDSGRRLSVDHDHETGVVRGLLCPNCNLGLGHFQDRPDLLRAAVDYIELAR